MSPSGLSPQRLGSPVEEGEEILQESEGMEVTRRVWPTESSKQSSCGLTETQGASTCSAWVCPSSSAHMLWLLAWCWCFCETPNSWSGCVFNSFACSWDFFFSILLGCLVQIGYEGFHFVLFYPIFVMFGCCVLETCSFPKGNRANGSGEARRGCSGGVEEGKMWTGCIVREENLFFNKIPLLYIKIFAIQLR